MRNKSPFQRKEQVLAAFQYSPSFAISITYVTLQYDVFRVRSKGSNNNEHIFNEYVISTRIKHHCLLPCS